MVREDIVSVRLEKLREYIKTLKVIQTYSSEKFREDVFVRATAERYLHLSIESVLDIGNHVISDSNYRKPESYADVFEILAEEKVISKRLLRELEGMAAFRNILVHDYLRIDPDKVYQIVQTKVRYLEDLARAYGELL